MTLSDEEPHSRLAAPPSAGWEPPRALDLAVLEALLDRREVAVRLDIVRLLAAGGRGAPALRRRLPEEKNPLVLVEILDALADLADRDSLPEIERLAESHSQERVRRHALSAIANLRGWQSVPYLRRRLQSERSQGVRAALSCLLFVTGSDEGLPLIRQALSSPSARIKQLVANTLAHHAPRRRRALILRTLEEALAGETREEVVADLEQAIDELSQGRPARLQSSATAPS